MRDRAVHRGRVGLAAATGAALLALTTVLTPPSAHGDDDGILPFLVMGGTGMPLPDDGWVDTVQSLFFPATALFDGQPTFPTADPTALYTPRSSTR